MTNSNGSVLLVDDDMAFRKAAGRALERRGFHVFFAESGEAALQHEQLLDCDAAIIDLRMPGMNGLELLQELKIKQKDMPVIVLTGHGSINTAIDAIKLGAFHYLTKPCEIPELEIYLNKAIRQAQVQRENEYLRSAIQSTQGDHGIIGDSPAIHELLNLIERMKDSDAPVLVAGESGTGKELVARALHFQSKRREKPFIAVNCATLKPELLENELFGHVSGAFTGATNRKEGLLAVASGGSLFIDEIADMNTNVQASLLRVIETGEYRPLGSTKIRTTEVRIIAAANRDLGQEVRAGRFREDLFYRLNVLVIPTPPLRQHPEDIPLIVRNFLERSAHARKGITFSMDAIHALQAYSWPGNVRELLNICERAVILTPEPLITAEAVQVLLAMTTPFQKVHMARPHSSTPSSTPQTLDDVEREHIRATLEQVEHNVSRASELLGIDRRTLQRKMSRYGLRGS